MGLPGKGDRTLLHRFEQRGLGLGRGAVDLVGQQHLRENRPLLEAEHALARGRVFLEDFGADDIGRHQVGRELDAAELHVGGLRQRLDQQRLAQARHALDQCMAASEQADDERFDHIVLADDHLRHARLERAHFRHQAGDFLFIPRTITFRHNQAPKAY